MRLFNFEGPLINGLNRIVDFMILNILFIITCIPIVTIGAATTALHYTSLKILHDEGYVIRTYFRAFKENFKQSTLIWLPCLLVFTMLIVDIMILPKYYTGQIWSYIYLLNIGVLVILGFFFTLVFPLLAKFDNTKKRTLKNAVLISLRSLPWTLLSSFIWFLPVIISFFSPLAGSYVIMFWIFFGFSVSSYLMTYIYEEKVYPIYIL